MPLPSDQPSASKAVATKASAVCQPKDEENEAEIDTQAVQAAPSYAQCDSIGSAGVAQEVQFGEVGSQELEIEPDIEERDGKKSVSSRDGKSLYINLPETNKRLTIPKHLLGESDLKALMKLAQKGSAQSGQDDQIFLNTITEQSWSLKRHKSRVKYLTTALLLLFAVLVLLAGAVFASTIYAIEITKEMHSKDGALVSKDGDVVLQTANSEMMVARDGTILSRQHCNADQQNSTCVPKTGAVDNVVTWVTLTDLPKQSLTVLEKVEHVTYQDSGSIVKRSVCGFDWKNSSSMTLELTPCGSTKMYIRNGAAWLKNQGSGGQFSTRMIHQQRPGRRLQQQSVQKELAHSWEGLIDRYNAEISVSGLEGKRRRLQEVDRESLNDMVEWFGAIMQAKGWPEEAQRTAAQNAIDLHCDMDGAANVQPPQVEQLAT
jgi:hypothetical protein